VLAGDTAGLAEMLAGLWLEKLKGEGGTAELTILTPLDLERESVALEWRTPSFLVSRRLFVLPHQAELKKGPKEAIAAYLKEPAPHVVLFIPCASLPKKEAIPSIRGVVQVSLGSGQVESVMSSWARSEILRAGSRIESGASTFLAKWIGPDFPRFREEVAKLAAASGGKTIGEAEIRAVCVSGGYEMDPFAFADALIAGNRERVLPMFRKFSRAAEKEDYFKLLGAVAWKVRSAGSRLSAGRAATLVGALSDIDRGLKGESELSPDQFIEIRLLKLLA
jgi:DNA polymerase III delta subunit